jgi:hypothetical protein
VIKLPPPAPNANEPSGLELEALRANVLYCCKLGISAGVFKIQGTIDEWDDEALAYKTDESGGIISKEIDFTFEANWPSTRKQTNYVLLSEKRGINTAIAAALFDRRQDKTISRQVVQDVVDEMNSVELMVWHIFFSQGALMTESEVRELLESPDTKRKIRDEIRESGRLGL